LFAPKGQELHLPPGKTFALRSFTISSALPNGAITSTTHSRSLPILRAHPWRPWRAAPRPRRSTLLRFQKYYFPIDSLKWPIFFKE